MYKRQVKATGDELAAAAEQIDVLTVAPVSAPVSSTPPELSLIHI